MWKRLGVVIGMAMAVGCLQKETAHTLYISPDDQVTWVAVEADVRSDGEDPVQRYGEERDYLAAAAEGRHPIAKALAALAPDAVVRTQLLRDERPFRVQTDAAVGPVDRVLQRLFDAAGVQAVVRLTRDAGRTTLVVQFDLSTPNPGTNHPVSVLMEDFESFRLVLTDGRYISANGWDISNDVALLSKEWLERAEEAPRDGRRLELALSWEAR